MPFTPHGRPDLGNVDASVRNVFDNIQRVARWPAAVRDPRAAWVIALLTLEPHVLVGGPNRQWYGVDRSLAPPRPNPYAPPCAPDRRKHHAVDRQLRDRGEDGFTLRGVPLAGLLLKKFVDGGVPAIGVAALGV